jgi:phosphoribosylamine--glycine ligase
VLASAGYPGNFEIGFPIREEDQEGVICYAGVKRVKEQLVTAGGRVAAACARASTLQGAIAGAYIAAEGLRFNGRFMRRDIGQSALKHWKAE